MYSKPLIQNVELLGNELAPNLLVFVLIQRAISYSNIVCETFPNNIIFKAKVKKHR